MFKKFLLLSLSLIFGFILAEFLCFKWSKNVSYFENKENYLNYSNYHNKLHHIRELKFQKNFIYSLMSQDNINEQHKTLLLNGDSWAENILLMKNQNRMDNLINKFANKYNLKIYNSGTTSYSFSPMTLQLEILRQNFNINPNIIVSIIDQTDIGDEICRYKNRVIINKQNKILRINPENKILKEAYNLSEFIDLHKVLYSKDLNLLKIFKYKFIKRKYENLKNTQKINIRCKWKDIAKPLNEGLSDNDKIYIENVFIRYLNEVFMLNSLEKLVLVFHPHRNHILQKYNYFYFDMFKEIVEKSNFKRDVIIIDFRDNFKNTYGKENFELNDIFLHDDISSHLTEEARLLFFKTILDQISKKIKL